MWIYLKRKHFGIMWKAGSISTFLSDPSPEANGYVVFLFKIAVAGYFQVAPFVETFYYKPL